MSEPLSPATPKRTASVMRQAWCVALNELADALRTRRAAVVLLLYIAVAALTMNLFLSGLQKIEKELANVLQIEAGQTPGAVTRSLWNSDRFRRIISHAVRDDRLMRDLFGTPPEVLIHGGLSFFYTPLLVMLLTAHRIAEERASGSARYAFTRVGRLPWVCGKAGGLALLLLVSLLAGAAAAWSVARFRMGVVEGAAEAGAMFLWSVRSWIYALSFLGLALGLSQLTKSPGLASAFGVLALIVLSVLSWLSDWLGGEGWRQVWNLGALLSPYAFRTDLWRSQAAYFWPAAVQVVALGGCYLLGGYLAWRRRDA
jgi:ABC-type transport system involved in multi-copper enzyme maturation permease subunit